MTRRPTRDELRAAALPLALFLIAALLDVWCPLHAPRHTGAFFGIFVAIFEAVSWAFHAFASTAVTFLLTAYQLLRTGAIALARAVKSGLFEAGRATARVLRSTRHIWGNVIKPALDWAGLKFAKLVWFVKDNLPTVFEWLHEVKTRLDLFYNTYIRPITDTINFLRILNRTLETFHIHLLAKLDDVLSAIEQRIEEPFLWVRSKITWVENWIDRIVTADGFFQRLTLIRSMGKYAPDWMKMFWARQVTGLTPAEAAAARAQKQPLIEPAKFGEELGKFYRDGGGDYGAYIDELVPEWRKAVGLDNAA